MSETPRRDDERDAQLSALYRSADAELPPPALDDAIRAAARREVGARPRPAGAPFARWQMPLSIAAVLVLCVSLVVVMRDEGGELTQLPRADQPPGARARGAAEQASAVPKIELVPEATRSSGIGLKPSSPPAISSGSAADAFALVPPGAGAGEGLRVAPLERQRVAKQNADAREADAAAPRVAPSAFPEKAVVAAAPPAAVPAESSGRLQARRDAAVADAPAGAAAESRSRLATGNVAAPSVGAAAPAVEAAPGRRESVAADRSERESVRPPAPVAQATPAAAEPAPRQEKAAAGLSKESADAVAAMARLTPEKWLERIDELRRQGRLGEARAGLDEFRRRYPDYALPPALREWARP